MWNRRSIHRNKRVGARFIRHEHQSFRGYRVPEAGHAPRLGRCRRPQLCRGRKTKLLPVRTPNDARGPRGGLRQALVAFSTKGVHSDWVKKRYCEPASTKCAKACCVLPRLVCELYGILQASCAVSRLARACMKGV